MTQTLLTHDIQIKGDLQVKGTLVNFLPLHFENTPEVTPLPLVWGATVEGNFVVEGDLLISPNAHLLVHGKVVAFDVRTELGEAFPCSVDRLPLL